MPKLLKEGDTVSSDKHLYEVVTDKSFTGGQAKGYFAVNKAGDQLFLKMFMEPTARSDDAEAFRKRQTALVSRLADIPNFVCRESSSSRPARRSTRYLSVSLGRLSRKSLI